MTLLGPDALGHQALGAGSDGSVVGLSLGGSFILTGQAAALGVGNVSAAGAAFTLTGVSVAFRATLVPQSGSFVLSTSGAALKWSGLVITAPVVDNTGTPADVLDRVKRLIPRRWFAWVAPYRDAVLGGLSDLASWCYGLIKYARAQTRLSTAYGIWLDILSYDFLGRHVRRGGSDDDTFRALIRATILQERVTRAGMMNAIVTLTGKTPWIFEPWNTYDTGGYSNLAAGQNYGSFGYGVGRGGYGNMNLPCQSFLLVHKGAGAGVPGVGGYGSSVDGYGVGSVEYVGPQSEQSGITTEMVYSLINTTKPTGTTCWTQVIV